MKIMKYICIKVLIFIPIFWLSYIFEIDLSYPMILRIASLLFCLALTGSICILIIKSDSLTSFEEEPSVIYNDVCTRPRIPVLSKGNFLKNKIYNTFDLAIYIGELIAKKDCLKTSTAILIIIGFIAGNPFVNYYTGVRNEVEAPRGGYTSGNFHPLYTNKAFKDEEDKGVFDEYEFYSTKTFIFKESGVMSGYYPNKYKYWDFNNIIKLLTLPFFEACIKAIIWVPIYYLICISIYRWSKSKSENKIIALKKHDQISSR